MYCQNQRRTLVLTGVRWVSRQFPTQGNRGTEGEAERLVGKEVFGDLLGAISDTCQALET